MNKIQAMQKMISGTIITVRSIKENLKHFVGVKWHLKFDQTQGRFTNLNGIAVNMLEFNDHDFTFEEKQEEIKITRRDIEDSWNIVIAGKCKNEHNSNLASAQSSMIFKEFIKELGFKNDL